MTISTFDPIAVWYFNSNKKNSYYEFSNSDFGCYPLWFFWSLRKSLNILMESQILIVDKLTFLGLNEVNFEFSNDIKTVDDVMDVIIDTINTKKVSASIRFSGQTILSENGKEEIYNGIVQLNCSLSLGNLSITLFSDCWVPIDRDGNLQIDLAEYSSVRLGNVLSRIKDLGFDTVDPTIGEENTDELLPQFGYKVFLYDFMLEDININILSKEDQYCIKKYLWKNRKVNTK